MIAKISQAQAIVVAMLALSVVGADLPVLAQNTRCRFIDSSLTFVGSPLEQAKCLLRPVKMYGKLGEPLQNLPSPLDTLIGRPVTLDRASLQRYLTTHQIAEEEIGGSLADPVSRAKNNASQAPLARYFVIHDVSTPNYLNDPFPANVNEAAWKWNNLQRWKQNSRAHIYINRVGKSVASWNFKTAGRATKFETKILGQKSKGLFLHVELIQPRRRDPNGGAQNDAIAPTPGFTESQLDRLALVYIAASARSGNWMIPAFHAALDTGIPDAHDDPQNFELAQWATRLGILLRSLAGIEH
jgi:hypothetical protein